MPTGLSSHRSSWFTVDVPLHLTTPPSLDSRATSPTEHRKRLVSFNFLHMIAMHQLVFANAVLESDMWPPYFNDTEGAQPFTV